MRVRFPLSVAVVGALLVGGATTGGTSASWRDQATLPSSSVGSGAMGFQASSSPTALTVAKGGGPSTAVIHVTDTSTAAAKNLEQRVSITRTGTLPAGVTAVLTTRTGSTCTGSPQGAEILSPGEGFSTCLTVSAAGSGPATNATVTLDLTGRQVRGGTPVGWTATPRTVTVPVTVRPAAPVLRCHRFERNGVYSVRWDTNPGETYSAWASVGGNTDGEYTLIENHATSPYAAEIPVGMTVYGRLRANGPTGTSDWSNTVRLRRTGNGSSGISCVELG